MRTEKNSSEDNRKVENENFMSSGALKTSSILQQKYKHQISMMDVQYGFA